MGHVQRLGDLPVDSPGLDARVMPQLLGILGSTAEEALHAEGLAILHQRGLRHLVGHVIDVPALRLDAPLSGDPLELLGVLYGVVAALPGLIQGVADLAAVVRVGGSAAGGEPQVVAGHDAVDVAAADAPGRLGRDAAGTHAADTAADALFTKLTVGRLVLDALLPGVRTHLTAGFQQPFGGGLHLLDSDQFHRRNVESTNAVPSVLLSLGMILLFLSQVLSLFSQYIVRILTNLHEKCKRKNPPCPVFDLCFPVVFSNSYESPICSVFFAFLSQYYTKNSKIILFS